jgi:hypothetical protein
VRRLAFDKMGNVIATGRFSGALGFDALSVIGTDGFDSYVVKLDSLGNAVYLKSYGGMGDQLVQSLTSDGTSVFLGGSYQYDLTIGAALPTTNGNTAGFVAKLGASGAPVWAKGYGALQGTAVNGIALDGGGNVLITGIYDGTVQFDANPAITTKGYDDVFVAKLDPSGTALWSRGFGDADEQTGKGVVTDQAGDVFVTADFSGVLDFGKGSLIAQGNVDLAVAKLDPSGNALWSKRFGTADVSSEGVAVDAQGNVIVVGWFDGILDFGGATKPSTSDGLDLFVVKLDGATGAALWAVFAGGPGDQIGDGVAVDPSGDVLVAGSYQGMTSFPGGPTFTAATGCPMTCSDALFAKLGPDGKHIWSRGLADTGEGTAVAAGGQSLAVFGGTFYDGTIDFGDGKPLTGPYGALFIAEYGPGK